MLGQCEKVESGRVTAEAEVSCGGALSLRHPGVTVRLSPVDAPSRIPFDEDGVAGPPARSRRRCAPRTDGHPRSRWRRSRPAPALPTRPESVPEGLAVQQHLQFAWTGGRNVAKAVLGANRQGELLARFDHRRRYRVQEAHVLLSDDLERRPVGPKEHAVSVQIHQERKGDFVVGPFLQLHARPAAGSIPVRHGHRISLLQRGAAQTESDRGSGESNRVGRPGLDGGEPGVRLRRADGDEVGVRGARRQGAGSPPLAQDQPAAFGDRPLADCVGLRDRDVPSRRKGPPGRDRQAAQGSRGLVQDLELPDHVADEIRNAVDRDGLTGTPTQGRVPGRTRSEGSHQGCGRALARMRSPIPRESGTWRVSSSTSSVGTAASSTSASTRARSSCER